MRGSVSYDEVMEMTLLEKQLMAEFIENQIKQEQKNPLLKLMRL
jgi:hypothetical protein